MKIYTKTGDKGKTSLFGGRRCNKDNPLVEAYGAVDELNCAIGVVIAEVKSHRACRQAGKLKVKSQKLETILQQVQGDLFSIGAMLAGDQRKLKVTVPAGRQESQKLKVRLNKLEEMIDWMAKRLPEQKRFILPGGSRPASLLQLARAICRRAERRVVALVNLQPTCLAGRQATYNLQPILIYLNRLSDFLFTLAKWINKELGGEEIIWSE